MWSNKNYILLVLSDPFLPANLNSSLSNLQRSTNITTILGDFLGNQVNTFRLENIDVLKSGIEDLLNLFGCVWLVHQTIVTHTTLNLPLEPLR